MKNFETPQIDIMKIAVADVITTSCPSEMDEEEI